MDDPLVVWVDHEEVKIDSAKAKAVGCQSKGLNKTEPNTIRHGRCDSGLGSYGV